MRHRMCYTAEVRGVNWEWATQVHIPVLHCQKVMHWCNNNQSGLVVLLLELGLWDIWVMCRYKPSFGSCLGLYVEAAFEKHLNRLKQTCTVLLSLSALLGSTEPQNLGAYGHGLGTPALLFLAQREFCVSWNCPRQWTVGILIPKPMSYWETGALEVKTSWRQWINIFPWKSVLSEICWWTLLKTKLWLLSREVPSRQAGKGR